MPLFNKGLIGPVQIGLGENCFLEVGLYTS